MHCVVIYCKLWVLILFKSNYVYTIKSQKSRLSYINPTPKLLKKQNKTVIIFISFNEYALNFGKEVSRNNAEFYGLTSFTARARWID